MPTIGDKLTAIYDIKNKIRDAIVNKGGALHEKSALSDYPQAIYDLPVVSAPEDTYNYHPNPAWWDIKTIIENDEVPEGYVAVAAFLLVDSPYKTTLDVYDAYKTSDGMFYNSAAEHIWDTTKDKDSGEGYKTRYVIAYVKKDSDRWLGKMLCARKNNQGVFYAIPIGCLGMVWNVPVFISLDSPDTTFPVSANASMYADFFNLYKGKNTSVSFTYYALCICCYSWNIMQYIDITKKGKLVIIHAISAFSASNQKRIPMNLHYIAPLYELPVVYKELLADAISKQEAKYIAYFRENANVYASKSTSDTSEDYKNMAGFRWGDSLRNLELHVADKEIYANTEEPDNNFPIKCNLGGLYTNYYYNNNYYYYCSNYSLNGRKLTMVVEPNTIPLDVIAFYPISTWTVLTVVKYINRLFVFYPFDNYLANTENNCCLGIIDWTIINKSDTKPQVHLFPAYQLNGMPASKLNKFIVDYLQDRTGMSVYQMYITASQNEKLSSTTKQIIAKRNWTLVVFS